MKKTWALFSWKKIAIAIAILLATALHLGPPLAMKHAQISFSPPSDPLEYRVLAHHLLHNHTFSLYTPEEGSLPQLLRTPIYPLFIAIIEWLMDDPLWIIVSQQLLLGAAAYLLFLTIELRTQRKDIATIAALILLFEPLVLFFSLQTWSETLFLFFLSLILYLVTQAPSSKTSFLLGISSGLLMLTRPIGVLTAPLLAIPFLEKRWSASLVKQVVSAILGTSLIIAPWLIRNASLTKTLTLSSSGLYNTVAGVYTQQAPDTVRSLRSAYEEQETILRHPQEPITGLRSKLYTTDGFTALHTIAASVKEQVSTWTFLKTQFFCQASVWKQGWRGIMFEKYGKTHTQTLRIIADVLEYTFYGMLFLASLATLLPSPHRRYALPLWISVGAVSFMNVCISTTRMRTSILPILLVLSATGFADHKTLLHQLKEYKTRFLKRLTS